MRRVWPFGFNFVFFMAAACAFPFFVLYYQSLGFNGTQIGLLVGLTPLVILVAAPLWTGLADATRHYRLIMSLVILLGAGVNFLYPFFKTFAPILLVAVVGGAVFAPITSFADNATMVMLGAEQDLYGRIRLGGTLGFGLAAVIAGAIADRYGLKFVFWTSAALLCLAFVVSQMLVHSQGQGSPLTRQAVRALLTDRRWIAFLAVAFAGGLAFAMNNFFFVYMRALGASTTTMGLALTIGTITEIPVLFFANRLIRRLKARGLLILAMVITGLHLLVLAAATTPDQVLLLQLASGLPFPAVWAAGVAYAAENAPPGMAATGQGMFSAMIFGFGNAVGGLSGGPLLDLLGGRGLFFVYGAAVLAIVVLGLVIEGRSVILPESSLRAP